jgi:hypothetical protein
MKFLRGAPISAERFEQAVDSRSIRRLARGEYRRAVVRGFMLRA